MENLNVVELTGKLISVHEIWRSESSYTTECMLEILRESGTSDVIKLLVNNIDLSSYVTQHVSVKGLFRSRDIDVNGKLKVELYVYVQEVKLCTVAYNSNTVTLTGYVCRKSTLRTTPSGKLIADILVACNYSKDKTAYIPVVSWGKYARSAGKYAVGTLITVSGRIQSRQYKKETEDGVITLTAYELSASSINLVNSEESRFTPITPKKS